MDSVTRQILLIASGLGLGSYCLCLYYRRSSVTVGLEEFLLTGNRPVAAAVSIVGTIFSGSILFTGMVHFYRVFGWFLLPFYLAAAFLGLGFLTTRVRALGAGHTLSTAISPRGTLQRYQRLSRETGNRFCLYFVCLLYVVATLTTELSVFRGGLEAFGEDLAVPGATFVLVAITYAYVYLGGFRGVLLTDIIQMVTILVAFGILIATLVVDARQHGQSFTLAVMASAQPIDALCTGIAGTLAGAAIWSSAPEIWIRVVTLGPPHRALRSIRWALLGSLFVLVLPVIVVGYAAPDAAASVHLTEAFTVWTQLLTQDTASLLSVTFLVILVCAIFTTIDTLMLTFEQLLLTVRSESPVVDIALAGRTRSLTPLLIVLCFAAAMRLDQYTIFMVGAASLSFPIILFALIHIVPRTRMRVAPTWVFLTPIFAAALVIPITHRLVVEGRPAYYLVLLTVAITQGLCVFLGAMWAQRTSEPPET